MCESIKTKTGNRRMKTHTHMRAHTYTKSPTLNWTSCSRTKPRTERTMAGLTLPEVSSRASIMCTPDRIANCDIGCDTAPVCIALETGGEGGEGTG